MAASTTCSRAEQRATWGDVRPRGLSYSPRRDVNINVRMFLRSCSVVTLSRYLSWPITKR
eukprot:16439855-Heterocapsa_arctica.AAC.1